MRILQITMVLLITVVIKLDAQPLQEIPLAYKIEAADTAYAAFDYYNAVEWYEQAYDEVRQMDNDSLLLTLIRKIAECHYQLRDVKRAERWLERLINRDSLPSAESRFKYGRILKMSGDYEEAQKVLNALVADPAAVEFASLGQSELEGIKIALSGQGRQDIEVSNLGTRINTRNQEASPAVDQEGVLYFVTFNTSELVEATEKNTEQYASVFSSEMDDRGRWKNPTELEELNRPGYHIGHVSISPDGETLYFTRAQAKGGKITSSQLYYSKINRNRWGAPQEIASLNGDFINKHPIVGNLYGEPVLIFSSDRNGGFGGLDLYYAPLNRNDEFGNPVNLGEQINTPGDEITPFYDETGLYFSSTGHPGIGGFDIFKSTWDGTQWSIPENLGKGFNTSLDDSYFSSQGEDQGFLVSNREGTRSLKSRTCCDDIFSFDKREILIRLVAVVFDGETPLPGATVKIMLKEGEDLNTLEVQTNDEGNQFDFSLDQDRAYQVLVSRDGYIPDTADFNTVGVRESKNFRGTFRLEKLPESMQAPPETETYTINEPIRMNNIYYDLDDDKILKDAEKDLDFIYSIMMEYPEIKIELSSHTDSRGDDAYNDDLSQRRANSAKNYLIEKGISDDRIIPKGYGEQQILNRCTNGVQCSEIEHRLNRRTEFKIIEGPTTIEVQRKTPPVNDDGGAFLTPKYPKIKLKQEHLDLGVVRAGEVKESVMEFENVGDNDLIIDVVSACECTELEWPQKAIPPGGSGEIKIRYDSNEKEGMQEVTVDIFANTNPVVTQGFFTIQVEGS